MFRHALSRDRMVEHLAHVGSVEIGGGDGSFIRGGTLISLDRYKSALRLPVLPKSTIRHTQDAVPLDGSTA